VAKMCRSGLDAPLMHEKVVAAGRGATPSPTRRTVVAEREAQQSNLWAATILAMRAEHPLSRADDRVRWRCVGRRTAARESLDSPPTADDPRSVPYANR
jgi:hypothetical protein